jgi:hypothetical protein
MNLKLIKIQLLVNMTLTQVKHSDNLNLLSLKQLLLLKEDQRSMSQNQVCTMQPLINHGLMNISRTKKLLWEANMNGKQILTQLLVNMILTPLKLWDNLNLLSSRQQLLHIEDHKKDSQNQVSIMQHLISNGLQTEVSLLERDYLNHQIETQVRVIMSLIELPPWFIQRANLQSLKSHHMLFKQENQILLQDNMILI